MSHTPSKPGPVPQNTNPGYTDDDIKFGPLIKWTLSLWVVTGLTYLILIWFLRHTRDSDLQAKGEALPRQLPPESGPVLQANPIREVEQYRIEQAGAVNSYGVVDATSGVYRIPVAQAMKRLIEKNAFPSVAPAAVPAQIATPTAAPSEHHPEAKHP
jgi:hypothetical protein